jgi:hypothetical protein
VPQEARLRRRLQEPRGGFAGAFAQRRLTKRSRELRQRPCLKNGRRASRARGSVARNSDRWRVFCSSEPLVGFRFEARFDFSDSLNAKFGEHSFHALGRIGIRIRRIGEMNLGLTA